MILVGHKAAATIGLLFEQKGARHRKLANFNHQIMKRLIIRAVQTLLRVTLHSLNSFSYLIELQK